MEKNRLSLVMEEPVIPVSLHELRYQDHDGFIAILSFHFPDMLENRRNHFAIGRFQNHQFRFRPTRFLDRGSEMTMPFRSEIPLGVLLFDMHDLNSSG